jgi:guanylate kinase
MNENKFKLINIIGFSSSGKDTVARILEKTKGFKFCVSHTTRPMRSSEQQDLQYHFITNSEMNDMIYKEEFIEYRQYNTIQDGKNTTWHYGLSKNEIDLTKCNHIVCVDLMGSLELTEYIGQENAISIFINADYESRKLRAIARDINFEEDEFIRRYDDDKTKLEGIKDYVDYIVNNNDLDACIKDIECIIKANMKGT